MMYDFEFVICVLGYCGFRKPNTWERQLKVLLRPVYYIDDPNDAQKLPIITPEHLFYVLRSVDPEIIDLLGFRDGLESVMYELFPVPPMITRPSRTQLSEDDLTKNLKELQAVNTKAIYEHENGTSFALYAMLIDVCICIFFFQFDPCLLIQ